MKINVGSKNPTKLQAVKNVLGKSEQFSDYDIVSVDIDIEEFGHPKSMQETIDGAKKRAESAFLDCQLSVGLESGFVEAPGTKSGYFEATVCSLYDGKTHSLGLGPGYEWPKQVFQRILDGEDGSRAFRSAGLTDQVKIGAQKGAIHALTHGLVERTTLNELAVSMALIQLQNLELY